MSLGRERKGLFAPANLPVSAGYVRPRSRAQILYAGLGGVVLCVALYFLAFVADRDEFVSGGPVSSNHAPFENDCAKCHQPWKGATDGKCSACHEKIGADPGAYSFAAHYTYVSANPSRMNEGHAEHARQEAACATCHPEHEGRGGAITDVPDSRCETCHFDSFSADHPEFAFLRDSAPDDSSLKFTHVRHTGLVLQELGTTQLTRACLQCHLAEPDGQSFRPADFDRDCARCHSLLDKSTPTLAVWDPAAPARAGVRTLQQIRGSREPGTVWASTMSATEFDDAGAEVNKVLLRHRDPWVLDNLRFIRRNLFPEVAGDARDLLPTSGLALGETTADLYRDASQALAAQLDALRGRPEEELLDEIETVDSLLAVVRARTADPLGIARETAAGGGASPVPSATAGAWMELAERLSVRCQECHVVRDLGIARVQKSQRALLRARFDHRPHILDRACLQCHGRIAVAPAEMPEPPGGFAADGSACQNLPGIENCRSCHTPAEASADCVACHYFHPSRTNRANFLRSAR